MRSNWVRDYTVLVLRLQKALDAHTSSAPAEEYQPPEWYEQVQQEPVHPAEALFNEAQALSATLPQQDFEPQRVAYLAKHLRALETVSRRMLGERFSLQEEVWRCFDLQVEWVPDGIFEQAYALYDEGLPGSGSLAERLQQWKASLILPSEQAHLLPSLLQRALTEARHRTQALVPLPVEEHSVIQTITDRPVRAVASYLGNYRSRILLNPAVPFPLTDLFYVLCHEGYPGHLAEAVLKDEALIQQRGYLEQRVSFRCLYTPQLVISEGLALLAHEMVFVPGEEEQWLAEHIYPVADMSPPRFDLRKIHQATDLLWGVWCNAAWLLSEGRLDDEVSGYLMRYALMDEAAATRALASLHRPFHLAYTYTYFYGRRLLETSLQGPHRQKRLQHLLTQQLTPSALNEGFLDD